jgi:hypothetical protein
MKPPKPIKRRAETNPFDDDPLPGQVQPGRAYRGEARDELPPPQEQPRVSIHDAEVPEMRTDEVSEHEYVSQREVSADPPPAEAKAIVAELEKETAKRDLLDPNWNGVSIGQNWPRAPRPPMVVVNDLQRIAGVQVVFFVKYTDPKLLTDRLPLADFLRRYR